MDSEIEGYNKYLKEKYDFNDVTVVLYNTL